MAHAVSGTAASLMVDPRDLDGAERLLRGFLDDPNRQLELQWILVVKFPGLVGEVERAGERGLGVVRLDRDADGGHRPVSLDLDLEPERSLAPGLAARGHKRAEF